MIIANIILTFWILLGVIAVWRLHFGLKEDHYNKNPMDEDPIRLDFTSLTATLGSMLYVGVYIVIILGGIISFTQIHQGYHTTWWFKHPNK